VGEGCTRRRGWASLGGTAEWGGRRPPALPDPVCARADDVFALRGSKTGTGRLRESQRVHLLTLSPQVGRGASKTLRAQG